ncbi:hypothetical protein KI797_03430 [Aeromonas media]|nr:hypothetical protein KI797_03430 [Aeromonas media]
MNKAAKCRRDREKKPANGPVVSFYGAWITLFGGFLCHSNRPWLIRPHGHAAVIRADPLLVDGPDPHAILAEGLPGIRIIDPQLGRGMGAAGAATEQQNTQG